MKSTLNDDYMLLIFSIKKIFYYCKKIYVYLFCLKRKIGLHNFYSVGKPQLKVDGKLTISNDTYITMINTAKDSTLGKSNPCKITVYKNAELSFLGKVGMSNTTIVATKKIKIGHNVMIGGGVTIVDTDFHSMSYTDWFTLNDEKNMKRKTVIIGDNVFIGMNSIILKGVTIGNGAVIGAGSVVSKNIPEGEVWAGNPAQFIKKNE